MTLRILALILVICTSSVWCAKILAVFPVATRSHYILGNSLMKALAERGHDVTVISPYEDKVPPKNGTYRDVVLTGFVEEKEAQQNKINMFEISSFNPILMLMFIAKMMADSTEATFKHPNVQELIHSQETFDVVIIDQFMNEAHKILAPHFKASLIPFSTLGINAWTTPLVGSPLPTSYVPEMIFSYSPWMTFLQRLSNSLIHVLANIMLHCYIYPVHSHISRTYIPSAPDLQTVLYNSSLILFNSHPSLNQPVPTVPSMIEIGGFHVKPSGKLPEDLQQFLDEAEDGAIYFSMGSNLRSTDLPLAKQQALIRVFAKLKQKVLWKWENDDIAGKSANLKVGKWLPQQEILAHPNVRLFITHAGLLSTTETVYHGVPILAIPIYGDQKMNAQTAVNNGIGLILPYEDLNEDNLSNKLTELLDNPKYYNNAKAKSGLFHDRQVKPMDEAVYWVEYVIRHKGAPHLRVAALDLPWYKYFLLDVIAFVVIVGVIFLYVSLCLIRRLRSRCTKSESKTKKVKQI